MNMKRFTKQIVPRDFRLKPALLALAFLMSQAPVLALTVSMQPDNISMGIGYSGSHLTITGDRDPGMDVIIKISAPLAESHLKYKGKAAGIFWMKLGNMTFKPTPMVYFIEAPKPLDQMLSEFSLADHKVGYKALAADIEIESAKENIDPSFWIPEFIKFKEHERLYKVNQDNRSLSDLESPGTYSCEIDWPYQGPPGEYRLEAFAVKDQQVVDHAERSFIVKRAGVVALLSHLAFNKSIIYGIVAILVAALAGLGVGFVFKGGGGH